jgi:HEAT repeat protein
MAKPHMPAWCFVLGIGCLATGSLHGQTPSHQAASTKYHAPAKDQPDLPRLRELLYSRQQPLEQSQAALLLVGSESAEATAIVSEGLQRWERADVFQALATAIRLRADRRFQAPLVKALAAEQPAIREAATETLARLESAALVYQLLGLAQDGTAPMAARQAATATLGKCVQKIAAVALMYLLAGDSPVVRQTAINSLEEMTGENLGRDVFRWQQWWQRHKDLSEEDWLAARAAFFADRSRRLRDDLRHAEADVLTLQQTIYSKLPPGDRLNYLKKLINNEYPDVRAQVIAWIGEILPDSEGADQKLLIDYLLRLSEDSVELVQRQAVLGLEKVDDARALERLLVLLQRGSDTVRAAAARSLGRYRSNRSQAAGNLTPDSRPLTLNARVVAALEKALNDPSEVVVRDAAESLGSLGGPAVAPTLARLLRHPSPTVREAAAHALEQMSNPAVLGALCELLGQPSTTDTVRFSIIGALGKIGKEGKPTEAQKADVLKRLQTVLVRDADPGVRSRAATVLGDLGSPVDLALLWQRVTAQEDNRVQLKAWEAMIEIMARSGDWAVVSSWDKTLAEQRQLVRRTALLTELRNRWAKLESTKVHMDSLTGALVQALIAQLKWQEAMPLALDLTKRSRNGAELESHLRWLLLIGKQALDDHKPQEVLPLLNEIQDLLPQAPNALGSEFEALRRRATQSPDNPGPH